MKSISKFSIKETSKSFQGPWDPKNLTEISGKILRIAKFEGRYGDTLHTHKYDEFFLVLKGKIEIITEIGKIRLCPLEGTIIPKGIQHQPFAKKPALVLMLDPKN
ncbi:hypothetical protein M1271_05350 [Patescibacteria group bacterium]|nr:hypothetical protein [Patescibacteria group bacterium]MCL5797958.1 hypothetical protein [Patescibacteria group bacterium]